MEGHGSVETFSQGSSKALPGQASTFKSIKVGEVQHQFKTYALINFLHEDHKSRKIWWLKIQYRARGAAISWLAY